MEEKICTAVRIDPKDNVLTVLEDVKAGEWAGGNGEQIQAREDIPCYHKIATMDVPKGGLLFKYGQQIGYALADIHKGDWVHTHNADSEKPCDDIVATSGRNNPAVDNQPMAGQEV